jgi:hypothetical protein
MRLSREELAKKIEENDCKYSLSWSKLHCFIDDPFSFMLKYLRHIPEEKSNSYAFLGDVVHNGLEAFYKNEKTKEQIIKDFEDKLIEQSYSDINFVKDEEKNKQIEQNYFYNIKHFLVNYEKVSPHSKLETFVGWKFGDYFMQGYIDHMYPLIEEIEVKKNDIVVSKYNKQYMVIEDFKTSTLYQGAKIEENSGQLKLYAYMIHKMYNIPIESIKIGWNFLKYAMIDIEQKNGKIKTSKVLRTELADGVYSKLKTWGKHFKYTPEKIEEFYQIIQNNSKEYKDNNLFDGIPEEISEKFKIRDCFVEISLDNAIMNNFIDYVQSKIEDMTNKIELYKITSNEKMQNKIFWKDVTKENSFFFLNLCGYTSKNHLPLREYLNTLSSFENKSINKNELDSEILNFLFKDE